MPAYAGIPVTHRTLASTVAFITGQEDPGKQAATVEWPRRASGNGTLVFLMGMKHLPAIVEHLRSEGRPIDTPIALIRWGTRSSQRTVVGTLGDIVRKAEEAELEPPTVIVVGEVVRLRDQLNWFETRPLFSKRILVTRPRCKALTDRELPVAEDLGYEGIAVLMSILGITGALINAVMLLAFFQARSSGSKRWPPDRW
jgi:uroporphyrinogen III methyltransferase/synthase